MGDVPLVEMRSGTGQPDPARLIQLGNRLPFLSTKVVPPRCPGLIDRPRLRAAVSQLPDKRLAVIMAPAGFGKTSLAAACLQRLQQDGHAVAWLTIDSNDDEPPRFLFYLAQALQRACEGSGTGAIDVIQETFLINPQAIVTTLINDLADVDEEVYLFLEDYHWITNPAIDEAVAYFLKYAPSHCHVVLTTRTQPSLPLASLRAQNRLLEIDAAALRFDLHEARNFIETEKPGALDASDVRLLHERTEGWPAALRIVASSIQSKQDFGPYVRNLSGTQRSLGAYLAELLDGLPGELVRFMLRTAILDRLCAPLCDAVTGAGSSRDLLASIQKRQLLLAPLDDEGLWYRYHALLAEYLNQRLESELALEIPGLHRGASLWFASQELWTDAVQHALAAGDTDRALNWVKNCAMTLVKRGDLFTLLGWQRQFPTELMRSQPDVKVAIAWGMALAMRFEESLELLRDIERDVGPDHTAATEVLRCECQVIRSVAFALKDDTDTALGLAQDCLNRSADPWTANVASNVVRLGHLKAGDLQKFYATPWIPYSTDEDRRNVFASVYRRCIQGMAEAQQLRMAAAEHHYRDALGLAEQHVGPNSVAAALPASLIAKIRYDQGRMDEAEALLIDRTSLIGAATLLDCVLSTYVVMARIAAHRMNLGRAHALLEWAENLGNTRGWGRLRAAAMLERTRLYLDEGRVGEATEHAARLARFEAEYLAPAPCAWSDIHRYATLARAYVASAEGRLDEAISILDPLRREWEAVHNLYSALRAETLLSIVKLKAKRAADAVGSFRRVLTAFSQAGIHQPIVDEGADVGLLLAAFRESVERGGSALELRPHLDKLTTAWNARYQSEAHGPPRSAIAESLSTRETGILKLIAQGLSNKEIARTLTITPETVKSHVKHIFVKLSVEKRAQAVSRAQSLGLVNTR
jgi:ATP/maltotriose-dependent transcriptional regulator MalT